MLPDPACTATSSSSSSYLGLDSFQPQWLLLSESNDWRKRVQVAQRFVHAARVVIYRNRAQARLRKLRVLAARLKGSKDGLAGGVLQDLVVEGSIVHRPGIAPTQLLQPDNVRLSELPLYCPQAYVQRPQVNKGLYADFSALQTQPYKAEFEYKLLGYSPEDVPSLLSYVPLCQDQPLLPVAAEDLPHGMQCGLLPQCLSSMAGLHEHVMPVVMLNTPYCSGSSHSHTQFTPLPPNWSLEPEQMLQPYSYQHQDSTAEAPGLNSARASGAL